MSFLLQRGGSNRPLEVQRWQYFLRKQGNAATGAVDGQFGLKTETATKAFQAVQNIPQTGALDQVTLSAAVRLGYIDRPSDYYDDKEGANFPARPANLQSPTNAARNGALGCFLFNQQPIRPDAEAIHILGSCDGALTDWEQSQIVDVAIPQPIWLRPQFQVSDAYVFE